VAEEPAPIEKVLPEVSVRRFVILSSLCIWVIGQHCPIHRLAEDHEVKAKCSDCTLVVEDERRLSNKSVVKNDAINGVSLRVSERDN
jgi:hypothetical protein